ncbi:MAG TPA: hypothetical protein VMX13_10145 [Sedimentisphaerales bacterium]|nr:hypothetical protein [Sedimentisphaerales bacterium]
MDKEKLKKLAENPEFIPGIYNYCDRWCERCPVTQRCMNFALCEEQFGDSQDLDVNTGDLLHGVSRMFQVTREMLKEFAEREGIDLDSLDLQEACDRQRTIEDTVRSHECCRSAKSYIEMVTNWFDSARNVFEQMQGELDLQARLELPGSDPHTEAAHLIDSVEVIRWYQHQIYVKLVRAMSGTLEDGPHEMPKDSDGSAKIALIGIDRSIAAWDQMRNHLPEREDDILDILVHLDQLRSRTETTFPDARAFVRLGFDDIGQHG